MNRRKKALILISYRKLSLFSNVVREKEWGESYCYSYLASFAQLAQAQRHRTLSYEILTASLDTEVNFVLKCKERLCGCAQLEIAMQTRDTLEEYLKHTKETNKRVYNYLMQYATGARCTFFDYKCAKPCIWEAKNALDRMI